MFSSLPPSLPGGSEGSTEQRPQEETESERETRHWSVCGGWSQRERERGMERERERGRGRGFVCLVALGSLFICGKVCEGSGACHVSGS